MLQGISSNPNNLEPTFISTSRFVQSWCQYRFYQDTEYIRTDTGARKNPSYKHEHMFKISKKYVDHKVRDYYMCMHLYNTLIDHTPVRLTSTIKRLSNEPMKQ